MILSNEKKPKKLKLRSYLEVRENNRIRNRE
jgi:hypothetical protein